jgi:glutamate dehydrogenase
MVIIAYEKLTFMKLSARDLDIQTTDPLFLNFLFHFLDRLSEESIDILGKESTQHIVKQSFAFLKNPNDSYVIELNFHEGYSILYLLQKDRPFILDTLLMVLKDITEDVHLISHPIFQCLRDEKKTLLNLIPLKSRDENIPSSFESFVCLAIKSEDKEHLTKTIEKALEEITHITQDFPAMQTLIHHEAEELKGKKNAPTAEEVGNYLRWLNDHNFFLLGYRTLKRHDQGFQQIHGLGMFQMPIYAEDERLKPFSLNIIESDQTAFNICKMDQFSPVHKKNRIVSIDIGRDIGTEKECFFQIMGLFTRQSFRTSLFNIPILRHKAHDIFDHFGFQATWHNGKFLKALMESIPQDEFFHMEHEALIALCESVMSLNREKRLTCFFRPDPYKKHGVVLIYIPKHLYSAHIQSRFQHHIETFMNAHVISHSVHVSDFPFARLVYVISFHPNLSHDYSHTLSMESLEEILIKDSLTWTEKLKVYLTHYFDKKRALDLFDTYKDSFSEHYKEKNDPLQGVEDISYMHDLQDVDIRFCRDEKHHHPVIKVYHPHSRLALSDLLPIFSTWGIYISFQESYRINAREKDIYIHAFHLKDQLDFSPIHIELRKVFINSWKGTYEQDLLNQLIIKAHLNVREVSLIRTFLHYIRQVHSTYSLGYLEQVCIHHHLFIRALIHTFDQRFDPSFEEATPLNASNKPKRSGSNYSSSLETLKTMLDDVELADHDKVMRMMIELLEQTLRTNYFQKDDTGSLKDYISLKINSQALSFIPKPNPFVEIFVHAPWMEGVHLRSSLIARGGLRWSDRLQDYRTEILGLMKAQKVKNAVIVPQGAKGGFVVKKNSLEPVSKDEGIHAYETFIRGLLDITDNRKDDQILPPPQCVCYDNEDPYLVVAADKGTATFSDKANALSHTYTFWLGDAFASGGSYGYDHKKMGITARGAWESVRHHFHKKNIDVQVDPITVIGVGDMAGDVFGNGMLCSTSLKLLGAFNHRHIFIDPSPEDLDASYHERKRLFENPHLSWKDYNRNLISKGGGVFERSQKFISVSSQMAELFNIDTDTITPYALIQAMLCAQVDLLWFGGIGTYIKASNESHDEVGDKANDPLRVNARNLRAKVISEGANLGATQRGRIEYTLNGGIINTDAIDNVAGVNCSDHEVNLKILFQQTSISLNERNQTLENMTNDVTRLVLAENIRQNLALTALEQESSSGDALMNMMQYLNRLGHLDPSLEFLPTQDEYESRRALGKTLTRPEMCVLLAYAKNYIKHHILPVIEHFQHTFDDVLMNYFPKTLREKYAHDIKNHPLAHHILATETTNLVVDYLGPTFVFEIQLASGYTMQEVLAGLLEIIAILDLTKLPFIFEKRKKTQDFTWTRRFIPFFERITLWYLHRREKLSRPLTLDEWKDIYHTFPQVYEQFLPDFLKQETYIQRHNQALDIFSNPLPIFYEHYQAPILFELSLLAKELNKDPKLIFQYGLSFYKRFRMSQLFDLALNAPRQKHWENSALLVFSDTLLHEFSLLLRHALEQPHIDAWISDHGASIHDLSLVFEKIMTFKSVDLGHLSHHLLTIHQASEKFRKKTGPAHV